MMEDRDTDLCCCSACSAEKRCVKLSDEGVQMLAATHSGNSHNGNDKVSYNFSPLVSL